MPRRPTGTVQYRQPKPGEPGHYVARIMLVDGDTVLSAVPVSDHEWKPAWP